jgi:hypothetical protein
MKRDIELYRRILFAMEECPSSRCDSLRDLQGISHEIFAYHVGLMSEAGLIDAINGSTMSGIDWIPISITHEGHEFLDQLRSDTMWARTKDKALSATGTLTLETLKAAAAALIRHHLGS